MTGVIFKGCNLDNVIVPLGNTIIDSCHRQIDVQNDWDDWILDDITLQPMEPMNKAERIKAGLSIDPKDIPNTKWTEEQRRAFEDLINSISD